MEKSGFVKKEAVDSWGPTDIQIDMPTIEEKEELNFGICYIRSTKNNTHIHITDITGSETIAISTGGAKVKSQKDEGSSYAAMLAVQDVVEKAKERGINAVHVRMRGKGGVESKIFEVGGQTALRALARNGMKIGTIEDRTPYSTDGTRRASGRRGRRL